MARFKLAAKMGGLLEAKIESNFFDRLTREKKLHGRSDALFVKPVLRRTPQVIAKLALQLPLGQTAQPGQISGFVTGLYGQSLPLPDP